MKNTHSGSRSVREELLDSVPQQQPFTNLLLDLIPVVVVALDKEGHILIFNREAQNLSGYSLSEVLGKKIWDFLVPEEEREGVLESWRSILRESGRVTHRNHWRARDGREIYLDWSASFLCDCVERPGYVIGAARDITEERKAHVALERANAQLGALAGNSSDIITRLDTNLTFLYANPAIEMLTEKRVDEILGTAIADLGLPQLASTHWESATRAALLEDRSTEVNFAIEREGQSYFFQARISPEHDSRGRVVSVLANIRDLTAIRNTQEELHTALQRAVHLGELKSQFVTHISHELRTPLHAIIGTAELLSDAAAPTQTLEGIETIKTSAEHLLSVINQILEVTQLGEGQINLSPVELHIPNFVEQLRRQFQADALRQGIVLETIVSENTAPLILADTPRLSQILVNLLGNAIKFSPQGGRVTLTVAPDTSARQGLVWEVRDTGIGISPEHAQYIFEEFTQIDSSLSRHFEGCGLGLHISQGIAHLMGGAISVESCEGAGSSFKLRIPVNYPLNRTTQPPAPPSEQGLLKQLEILVVEDNAVNRRLAVAMLEKSGHRPHAVESGSLAVEVFQNRAFDAVLLDIQMPGQDGYETARQIRSIEQHRRSHTPIIAMTAHAFDTEEEKCKNAGMDGFLAKPFSRAELASALAQQSEPQETE